MPRLDNLLFKEETNKSEQGILLHLIHIKVPENGATLPEANLYLCDGNDDVTFDGKIFTAFPLQISSGITYSSDGSIDKASITFANPERTLMPYVQQYNHMRGTEVTVYTVYEKFLSTPGAYLVDYYVVDSYGATEATLTLALDPSVNFERKLPRGQFNNNSCRFKYKDPETCKYAGDLPYCDKTLIDCKRHTVLFFNTGTVAKGTDKRTMNSVFYGPTFPTNTKPGYVLVINDVEYTIKSVNVTVKLLNDTVVTGAIMVEGATIPDTTTPMTYKILKGNQKNYGAFPGVPSTVRRLIL